MLNDLCLNIFCNYCLILYILKWNYIYFKILYFSLLNCSFPKFSNILNGVWYTSSIGPLRISGRTRSIFLLSCKLFWSILPFAILIISLVAALITLGATFAAWLTVSALAYAKPKKPPIYLFVFKCVTFLCLFCIRFAWHMMKF